ncbi:MAG: ribonuclease D [Aestuariivita sp.]|nr:ribonuclease D [Aestuariivita sp.]MCY4347043.1 ribonuclease D [Aestuariivita sp.]
MRVLTKTSELANFCQQARQHPFVTVDTEFIRERTYFAKLCLVQLAFTGEDNNNTALVDPLSDVLSLEPFYELLSDESVVKVFHAARQDIEIFFSEAQIIPKPLFDTQIAAMVCGYGDQVGYETLVRDIAKFDLNKSSRISDWSQRPLTNSQKCYAIADVTHLRVIYEHLKAETEARARAHWLEGELELLLSTDTYRIEPREIWKRIKSRNRSPRFLAILRELAAFRELYAQQNNIPRSWVLRDEVLVLLANRQPKTANEIRKTRLFSTKIGHAKLFAGVLEAISKGQALSESELPKSNDKSSIVNTNTAASDLLKVLLKTRSKEFGVAAKLIASSAEIEALAAGERSLPVLSGWRREIYGKDALRLCEGKLALSVRQNLDEVEVVDRETMLLRDASL